MKGGPRYEVRGGEGEVVADGAGECPKGAGEAREDEWGEGVWEMYPWCAWGISYIFLLLLFAYFNFGLYIYCFYDAEIEFVGSIKLHKFKSVWNSREWSSESCGWYKRERKFFYQPGQYWTHTSKVDNIEIIRMIINSIPDPFLYVTLSSDPEQFFALSRIFVHEFLLGNMYPDNFILQIWSS